MNIPVSSPLIVATQPKPPSTIQTVSAMPLTNTNSSNSNNVASSIQTGNSAIILSINNTDNSKPHTLTLTSTLGSATSATPIEVLNSAFIKPNLVRTTAVIKSCVYFGIRWLLSGSADLGFFYPKEYLWQNQSCYPKYSRDYLFLVRYRNICNEKGVLCPWGRLRYLVVLVNISWATQITRTGPIMSVKEKLKIIFTT